MPLRRLSGCLVLGWILALCTASMQAADAQPDEFVRLIVKLIGNKDPEFRAAGLEQVRTAARGPAMTQLFAARLETLDADGQIALLNALADRGDHAARAAVVGFCASSPDARVRAAAITALGRLGEPDDLPLLVKTLSAKSSIEQSAARQSLVQLSGETINKSLATASQSASPAVKAALIDALAARRAGDQLPAFVAASVNDDARVRKAAMSALGQVGRPDQIAEMLPGVLKAEPGAERDDAEENVVLVCDRITDADKRAVALIEALNTIDATHRDQLLALVGRVGGRKLIDFVGEIATGNDRARRKTGIDALSKWPDASVADKLLEIAAAATDPAERSRAFRGYVRVSATRDNRSDQQRLDRLKQAMQAARTPEEITLVINRVRTAYDVDALRFVLPYVDRPQFSQIACETIVEIAHHREVRDPNKSEVDKALDKVIATSKNPVVVDRANRYKRGETWDRRSTKSRR